MGESKKCRKRDISERKCFTKFIFVTGSQFQTKLELLPREFTYPWSSMTCFEVKNLSGFVLIFKRSSHSSY